MNKDVAIALSIVLLVCVGVAIMVLLPYLAMHFATLGTTYKAVFVALLVLWAGVAVQLMQGTAGLYPHKTHLGRFVILKVAMACWPLSLPIIFAFRCGSKKTGK